MNHLIFADEEQGSYPLCFLVPSLNKTEMLRAYIEPYRLDPVECLALTLHYGRGKKTSAAEMRAYIEEELKPVFDDLSVQYLIVTDGDYFKILTGAKKVDASAGYVLDCLYGSWKVLYVPSHRQIFYDPQKVTSKIAQGMHALQSHRQGTYEPPGNDLLKEAHYPQTDREIVEWLNRLLDMDCPLTIDIEAFSLKPHTAGIGTISFAWSKHEGIAFPVDYVPIEGATEAPYGRQEKNETRRGHLRWFFMQLTQRAIYHNIAYDVSVLIFQLYMEDITDTKGLLEGIDILLDNWDCTKLITYLATNSCAGNKLSLKDQAQEFAGDYSMGDDIKDITLIPLDRLLEYNLIDACSTWFVHEKHWNRMVADQQLEIYVNLFKPATKDIIQMQLTGLPVNMRKVKAAQYLLERAERKALRAIQGSPIAQQFTYELNEKWVEKRNAELKKKRVSLADAKEVFNPNSGPQLQALLYEMLGLPVISYTDSKAPATDSKTLKDLQSHTTNPEVIAFLQALLDHGSVNKILTSFIPAMLEAVPGSDGWHYLCGNFNLGGTLSGRLSSSNPNLQNLPANSKYAKLIKWCVEAPPGKVFVGLDFSSLEDRISALTTKDPNKLKVYTDGFDGHAMRAVAYWGEQMPDIDPNSVASVNSLAEKGHKYGHFRQDSKIPTFSLTYAGTYNTLMTNCGFSMEKALQLETRYRELYKVSIQWVEDKLNQAAKDGFVTVAFGLRVRTPLLAQVVRKTSKTPKEAEAEGRSAGNALGQSWCLLNSRAWVEFMGKVRKSKHRLQIRPCAQIHDAGYALLDDDMDVLAYVNEHLVEAVKWQDDPAIWHDQVKLGGELSIFWPTWRDEIVIPNGVTAEGFLPIIQKALEKR